MVRRRDADAVAAQARCSASPARSPRAAPVAQLIGARLPWTLALVLTAVLVAGTGGAALGLTAAWRRGGWDRAVVGICTSVAALPEFLVALVLLLTLAVGLGWFPLSG